MAKQGERYTRSERDKAKIVVKVRGQSFDGWLQSEVERSIEAISGTFNIPVSLNPGSPPDIKRQDEVEIWIGSTRVMVGYVLAAEPFYRHGDCGMRIVGRDRTGDLVHASALHKGGQWRGAKLERIARDMVERYGIEVVLDADQGAPIKDFKLYQGETVVEALSRAARLRGMLVTRDNAGRLLLTKAGKDRFAGAIVRGHNVISMDGVGSDDRRHSEYIVYGQSNCADDFDSARSLKAIAKDAEIRRYMPLVINADGNTTQAELQELVNHTVRVRRGHAYGFRYVLEGWTFDGEAWPVNQRVPIYDDIAGIDGAEWLIVWAKQTCDLREGDVTEVIVRPVEAYDTVPLQTNIKRKRWAKRGDDIDTRGPRDRAKGT